ncbi:Poly(A) polymerase central domain-containing protein [Mucor lusitanicus]|uniref:polynucleotide adenylyltransferase n=2 Tax=Mucor circinelloides f. lusitanicus TaxID=29924 RepID=A0A168LUI8_MUCCL|nr:Poly(A) polymerase central domain-containing protein [Mucor lusitanicus]OAD03971.1 hypothetical protein MUCCIDRAFT_110851 [Mucor lusitanicus CBS 277.49]
MSDTRNLDNYWVNYLKENNVTETEDEISKREKVVFLLNSVLSVFARNVADENNYRGGEIPCFLKPFGSYGLGGYIRDADIDIVLICSQLIKRRDFFRFFPDTLRHLPTVREIESIKKANVPIIKCVVDNISVDISFVRLRDSRCDKNMDLLDDRYMQGIHETCRASMDGPRVNSFIKKQIENRHVYIFQRSLQCIKHWATRRQIYNKPIGYLNGSSWTLLLLKTYMDMRDTSNLSITLLVCTFFSKWRDWAWPAPVLLTSEIPGGENGRRIELRDIPDFQDAVMPIVTPCYPVSSAAPNVTKSTLKIMTREFERAAVILDNPVTEPKETLNKLFNNIDYFKRYQNFITIITSSELQSSHETWQRKMPNVIPHLLQLLEKSPNLKCIQPVTKPKIEHYNYRTNEERKALELGMSVAEARQLDLNGQLIPGMVYLSFFFIGIQAENSCQFLDLSEEVELFEKLLHSRRTKYDDDVRWHITALSRKKVKDIIFSNN